MAITVQRSAMKLTQGNPCKRNWTIQLVATATEDDDPNIFVYHCQVDDNDTEFASFNNIANLQDLNIIPVNASTEIDGPISADNIPYFRTSTVTLDFYNTTEMENTWHWIKKQIQDLVNEKKAANNLVVTETILFK